MRKKALTIPKTLIMKKIIFLLFFLGVLLVDVAGQNITYNIENQMFVGKWIGFATQEDNNGAANRYKMELNLEMLIS